MVTLLDILPGIIWSGFLGLAFGNFATNPIYRLPRNESLFGKDPYCGDCNALLKPRDLFPVLSWCMTRGKCRYCGAVVPGAYTLAELLTCLAFIAAYLQFGFTEKFFLISFGITAFIMIAMMLYIDNFFSDRTLVAAMAIGAVYRTLMDGTVYDAAGGAFAGLIVGVVVWRLSGVPMQRETSAFPLYLKLLVASGLWLATPTFYVLMLASLIALPFKNGRRWIPEYVIITLTSLLVLAEKM